MTKDETLLYELETLASHDPEDLDYPEIEVFYEDSEGRECSETICVIKLAKKASNRIAELLEVG